MVSFEAGVGSAGTPGGGAGACPGKELGLCGYKQRAPAELGRGLGIPGLLPWRNGGNLILGKEEELGHFLGCLTSPSSPKLGTSEARTKAPVSASRSLSRFPGSEGAGQGGACPEGELGGRSPPLGSRLA